VKVIGVTGGTGFIGSYVIQELQARGYEAIAVDHSVRSTGAEHEVFAADVRDRTAMTELAAHVDGMIHLAAVLGTQETISNPLPAAETNILGGIAVLDACRQYDLPLVYAGVGNFWMRNTYSTTKTCIENLLYQYRDEFGCRYAAVRPVNAYGPRQRAAAPFAPGKVRKIVPAFVCRALSNMPIEIYGDGTQISDMVFVSDVAKTFVNTLETLDRGKVPATAIEVGPEESVDVNHVAENVREIASTFTNNKVEIVYLPMRPGEKNTSDASREVLERVLDYCSQTATGSDLIALRRALRTLDTRVVAETSTLSQVGIDPVNFVSLEEGLRQTVEWFSASKGLAWSPPTTP
jgi:UDP-glucose 4-epimerase